MLSRFPTYTVAALILFISCAKAGPGADIFACLSLQDPVSLPLDISFDTTKDPSHCMNSKGDKATITATEPGLTCTEIGYVEAKRSGWCAFGASIWSLEFETANGTSGAMVSKWSSETKSIGVGGRGKGKMNLMIFKSASVDVMACPAQEVCGAEKVEGQPGIVWDAGTRGPVYVIFKP